MWRAGCISQDTYLLYLGINDKDENDDNGDNGDNGVDGVDEHFDNFYDQAYNIEVAINLGGDSALFELADRSRCVGNKCTIKIIENGISSFHAVQHLVGWS